MKNKLTIADIAELLGKKKAKYEKLANSKDKFENNTAKIKLGSINNLLDQLFQHQEATKPVTNNSGLPKAEGGLDINPFYKSYYNKLFAELYRQPFVGPERYDMTKDYIGTKKKFKSAEPIIPEEKYIDDIPFDTASIATPEVLKQYKNAHRSWAGNTLRNPNVQAGIGQGLGMLGDYINQIGAINRTNQPDRVATVPKVRLNKNMDTSDLKRQAVRALRTSQMQANQSGNTNVSNAVRSDLLGAYFDQLGKISSAENNYRSQMENSESQQNAAISAQNAMILNELYAAQNQFANNKTMAKANALSGLLTKGQMIVKDYRDQNYDMNVRLPIMKGAFNQQSNAYMDSLLSDYFKKYGYFNGGKN